jgi:hypothetical protein
MATAILLDTSHNSSRHSVGAPRGELALRRQSRTDCAQVDNGAPLHARPRPIKPGGIWVDQVGESIRRAAFLACLNKAALPAPCLIGAGRIRTPRLARRHAGVKAFLPDGEILLEWWHIDQIVYPGSARQNHGQRRNKSCINQVQFFDSKARG